MKRTGKILGMAVLILSLSLVVTGCSSGSDEVGDDDYKLAWGVWVGANYSTVSNNFRIAGYPLTAAGSNAGYLTGSDATEARDIVVAYFRFDEEDANITGSFENLVNYSARGIGAPQGLKDAMLAQKGNVPIAGVFQHVNGVSVFIIERR